MQSTFLLDTNARTGIYYKSIECLLALSEQSFLPFYKLHLVHDCKTGASITVSLHCVHVNSGVVPGSEFGIVILYCRQSCNV